MPISAFDSTIRITDILTVIALFAGPITAILIADRRQRRQLQRAPKEWIFRTLMTTKSSPHALEHINAINLVGLLFRAPNPKEQEVIETWKLYRAHLDKGLTTAPDWWEPQRIELLNELLYKLGTALQVPLTKSEIKTSTSYYTTGQEKADRENLLTRTLWLEILQHKRALPITNELKPPPPDDQHPPTPPQPPPT